MGKEKILKNGKIVEWGADAQGSMGGDGLSPVSGCLTGAIPGA
jgi:hypothetical protein